MNPELKSFPVTVSEFNKQARNIGYWQWGDVNNPKKLFCVHGLTRNGRDFDYLAKELSSQYHVICPDVAGRGKSDWLKDKNAYNIFTYAHDLTQLIMNLKITKLDWVGTSMGGMIGFIVASSTSFIEKFVVNDVGPLLPKAALYRIAQYTGSNPKFENWADAEKFMRIIYQPWCIKKEEHWQHIKEISFKRDDDGNLMFTYDPGIGAPFRDENGKIKVMEDISLWEFWEKIKAKTLVLRGTESDLLSKEIADKMTQTGPQAKLIELEGIGHAPSLYEADQIKIVKDFLLA